MPLGALGSRLASLRAAQASCRHPQHSSWPWLRCPSFACIRQTGQRGAHRAKELSCAVPTTARSAGECTSNRAYMSGDGDTLGACRRAFHQCTACAPGDAACRAANRARAGYLPLLDGEQGAALA